MSRRRLEKAIQAGKAIEQGQAIPDAFEKIDVYYSHGFDELRDGVYSLQYNFEGNGLAVGYGDGGIDLLALKSGELKREAHRSRGASSMAVTCLRFCPKEQHLVYACCESKVSAVSVIRATSTDIVSEPSNEINCLDFSLEGNVFGTAGKDMAVRLYDSITSELVHTYEGYSYISPEQQTRCGHAQRVFALKFHPEHNEVFITGGWDNQLKIWDSRTKEGVQRTIHGPHICGDSIDIKGSQVLTGSWVSRDALQLWDYASGQLIQTLPLGQESTPNGSLPERPMPDGSGDRQQKGEFIYCAHFGGNDVIFAGGSGTNSVMAISTLTCQVIGEVKLGHSVQAIDSTSSGQYFAAGGATSQVKMVRMS